MAEVSYTADIKKFTESVDQKAVDGILRFLGIALKSRDSSHVACSSNSELERVRESFLKRKLKLSEEDAALDGRIRAVCEAMKADTSKHRVTFYYLLAEKAGKLGEL